MLNDVYQFLVINNFSAVVTFIVGLFAFFVYSWQKRDKKVNTARLILSEIRIAEQRIQKITELIRVGGQDLPVVLPSNTWNEYSYLFASDFDQDELTELNHFFSNCESIDEYVKRDNEYFWITTQYRAQIAQNLLSKFIEESFDEQSKTIDELKLDNLMNSVLTKYVNHPYSYSPQRTINELKKLISNSRVITTSTTGNKLKNYSNLNLNPWYRRILK
jgi:hypothetical protein